MAKKVINIRWNAVLLFLFFSYDLIFSALFSIIKNELFCNIFIDTIIFIILFLTIIKNKKKLKLDAIIVIIVSIMVFLLSYIMYPQYRISMLYNESWNIFKMIFNLHGGLFAYLIIRTEDSFDDLIRDLKISIIPVWLCYTLKTIGGVSFNSVSAISGNIITRNYNQTYGFKFLYVALMLTYIGLSEKKKIFLAISIIPLLQIVMYASRTAIIAYVAFIVLYFIFNQEGKNKNIKRCIYIALFALIAYIVQTNYFLNILTNFFQSHGLSSKIIDAFINDSNNIDGGRLYLWSSSYEQIKNNFWGLGVYYDRYIYNVYVHNIFLELLLNYGWIFGAGIIAYIIKIISTMFIKAPNKEKTVFLIFFSLSMIRLMLSYSYWYDINFWIMIAIYSNYIQ